MIDREKVINGLELLAHWPNGLIITDQEKWIKPFCETAVSMLKEQEAVEPECQIIFDVPYYFCGSCKTMLNMYAVKAKYCSNCGRWVNWK